MSLIDDLIDLKSEPATPIEILTAIAPSNPLYSSANHKWIFRGQLDGPRDNEPGELIASAHRQKDRLATLVKPGIEAIGKRSFEKQMNAELQIVMDFAFHATKQGLPLPGLDLRVFDTEGEEALLSRFESVIIGSTSHWPIDSLLCATSIAQHYGIPTCMLDWTESGRVALYFASASAASEENKKERNIAVWAINTALLRTIYPDDLAYFPDRIRIIDAPRSICPTLAAQQGIFTVMERRVSKATEIFTVLPIEVAIHNRLNYIITADQITEYTELEKSIQDSKPFLVKYTIDKSHAGTILRLLAYEGISPATLFPGYQGITNSIHEEVLWDETQQIHRWKPRREIR